MSRVFKGPPGCPSLAQDACRLRSFVFPQPQPRERHRPEDSDQRVYESPPGVARATAIAPLAASEMARTVSAAVGTDTARDPVPLTTRRYVTVSPTRPSNAIDGRPSRSIRNGDRYSACSLGIAAGVNVTRRSMALAHALSEAGSTTYTSRELAAITTRRAAPGAAVSSRLTSPTTNAAV